MNYLRLLSLPAILLATITTAGAAWQDHIGKTLTSTVEGPMTVRGNTQPMSMDVTFTMGPEGLFIIGGAYTIGGKTTPPPENYPPMLFKLDASTGTLHRPEYQGIPASESPYTLREENGAFVINLESNPEWKGYETTFTVKFGSGADCVVAYKFETEDTLMDLKATRCEIKDTP